MKSEHNDKENAEKTVKYRMLLVKNNKKLFCYVLTFVLSCYKMYST